MAEALQKLLNELPTILVALWAVLNALGVTVGEQEQASALAALESLGAFAIWLLVRRNTDGPVTALKNREAPGTPQEVHD